MITALLVAGVHSSGAFGGHQLDVISSSQPTTIVEPFNRTAYPKEYPIIDIAKENNKVASLIDEIAESKHLEFDWNGYDSDAPNSFSMKLAEWILLETPRYKIPDRV